MKKIIALFGALTLLLGVGVLFAGTASATGGEDHKRWVCKYVGTPGEDERLKDGKNPISVDSAATVGTYFNDAQGRSFVLAVQTEANTGEGNTYTGALTCPPGDDGDDPTPTPTPTTPTPTPTVTEQCTEGTCESETPTPTPTETTPTPTPTETTSTPTPTPTESTPTSTPTGCIGDGCDTPDELPKTGAPAPLLAGLGSLLAALGAGAMWLTRKPGLHE